MMVNGVEQVRIAMLAVPSAVELDKTPPEGESWSRTVVTAADEQMCANIRLVAEHVGDKVSLNFNRQFS